MWREVERLASLGTEGQDIVLALGLPVDVVERERARFEAVVAAGNARHRVSIVRRLEREGIRKGRAHSLLALARNRLGFDKNLMAEALPDTGAEVRLVATIERLRARRLAAGTHVDVGGALVLRAALVESFGEVVVHRVFPGVASRASAKGGAA